MNSIPVENVIATLADQFILNTQGRKTLYHNGQPAKRESLHQGLFALKFKVRVDYDNFGYVNNDKHVPEWERHFRRSVYLIITANHNVFAAVTEPLKGPAVWKNPGPHEYENTSNHDSCWRSEGLRIVQDVLWEGYEYCWNHVPAEHRKCMAHTSPFLVLGSTGCEPAFDVVRVRGEYNKDDDHRWILTDIQNVDYQFNIIHRESENDEE